MKKNLLLITVLISLSLFSLVGCGKISESGEVSQADSIEEVKKISVSVPDGLPAMSIAKLIKENNSIDNGFKVEYEIQKTAENLVASVLKEEADIAIVPSNVAALAYNRTDKYKIIGTAGLGSFYLISSEGVNSLEDLKGKELLNIGRGLTPDIITKSILKDSGIDIENDIDFTYLNAVTELVPNILTGKSKTAIVPEPALSAILSQKDDMKVVLELNEEWQKINNTKFGYPQATIIAKSELIEENKEFIVKFLEQVSQSIEWAYNNKEELGNYSEEIGISAKKPMIIKSMERANIKYIGLEESKEDYMNYFNKLNEFDPKTIGGKVPDEGIFMEK